MTCPRCGRSLPATSARCASCGAVLSTADAERSEVRRDDGPSDAETTPRPDTTDGGPDASAPNAAATGSGAPVDPDATGAGVPLPAFDPDVTRAGVPRRASAAPPPAPARGLGTYADAARALAATRGSGATRETGGTRDPGATRGPGARGSGEAATDLVGKPLGTRYQILKLLGAGGMGAVYQAWDHELQVVVGLKTVRPEVAVDPETARVLDQRFKQELLLARQITHKNIVRVHDIGEVDGIKYITMPFLEGENLATILKAEGKLKVSRVMPIARQVASGLVAAHEAGVVHRDLKPANIMIEPGGDALIMDFGVARSTARTKPLTATAPDGAIITAPSATGTQMGSVVGTIEYMAPEQARAQPVDQRADIYAFGLIFYDLLLGRTRASRTESAIAELNLRMKQPPPSPRTLDPTIPEALDRLITRCVQSDPDARYATTTALLADLNALDDEGVPLPEPRRLSWWMAAATLVVVAGLVTGTWWLARGPAAPIEHDPVSVVVADFENRTGDPGFDRTLEPMMRLALEGAGFITAFDRSSIRSALGVRPPERLDERAAMELAVKQGVGVVLSGSIQRQGGRYVVEVKATRPVTGELITEASDRTTSRDEVLALTTQLATPVRRALGDTTSYSAQRFAMETLSATSLEAVREYARGMDALSRARFDEALQGFTRAVEIDPNFGSAYGAMSIAARNLERMQDARQYIEEALRHLDSMTERERYRTRGMYYLQSNDHQACVKEYGELIARYSADASARNNRALCLTYLRELPGAVEEMRQAVRILPNRALYRENLALYTAYSSDFLGAGQEVEQMAEPGTFGLLARAFAQVGQGQVVEAAATYRALGAVDEQGASYMISGLADIAIYEGRYGEAVTLLTEGAAIDTRSGAMHRAASKLAALAHAQLLRQQKAEAVAAAEKALAASQTVRIRFLAARVFAEAGATAKAREHAVELSSQFQNEPQAYGRIIEGLVALEAGQARQAVQVLTEANDLLDTWIGHFDLGRAYLAAGALPQADSEFDRCVKRRGEALSLFLDEMPTYGYLPPVFYYQGRVREGLNSMNFAASYRAFIEIRGSSTEDRFLPDARRRAAR